jgi:HD domain
MKPPVWRQRVLLVSDDAEIRTIILPAFGSETELVCVANSQQGVKKLEEGPFQVLILDTSTTDPKLSPYAENPSTSSQELIQFGAQMNHGITTVVITNKMLAKSGIWSRKGGASLIMDRKSISLARLQYVIRVLRKRSFRTILTRDLQEGLALGADLYHFLPANNRYSVFLPRGEAVTAAKLEKLRASRTKHLYSLEGEFEHLASALRTGAGPSLSERLAHIRSQFLNFLRAIFDISTDGSISRGKTLLIDGQEIVAALEQLVAHYPDPLTCLAELPFPRWSAIAHGINGVILSTLFQRAAGLPNGQEISWAALTCNLGLADIDQSLLSRSEFSLSAKERAAYHKHPRLSIDLLKEKQIPIGPRVEAAILSHHENYDGSGYPDSLAESRIPLEAALLSIVGAYDHLLALEGGRPAHSPTEAWKELLRLHGASPNGRKFHPALLEKVGSLFV